MLNHLDIRKHEFSRAWRGYDRDEVHALLDALAREFEDLSRRSASLLAELRELRDEADRYQKNEKTLQDAALTLQQAMDEKRRAAEREVEAMLQDGRDRAAGETRAGLEKIAALRAELQSLEDERARFYARFQNMLRSQAEILDAMMAPDGRGADAANAPEGAREG